ncbi:hypothetical protein EsH8_VIII_000130 [Colletotrichum jinshuiense]
MDEDTITVLPATPDDASAIIDFVTKARVDMFPMLHANPDLDTQQAERDKEVEKLLQTYFSHSERHSAFLTARSNGQIIATIGYHPYDYRFPHIDMNLRTEGVVEIVRLSE